MTSSTKVEEYITDSLLRQDRMPHIWCPGCGIGPAVGCFIRAIESSGLDQDKIALISGIGCTGRVAGYVKLDSFHTTHGRALPFAMGLGLGNPELNVVVFSGDGDLIAIGGNHLIHTARRNVDMTVICLNNFNYGMTGGQMGPTTPLNARSNTSPYGNIEYPFNVPYLVAASGATYVARWTMLHARQLEWSIAEALTKPGFSFIEVLGPCPTLYGRMNKMARGMDSLNYYKENSVVRNGADPKDVDLTSDGPIVVGKFVDIERPTFWEQCQLVIDRAQAKKD
ncbi:MAG: 2-oxoacid:ferredoxin oxidoreductase subunit beta [Dehalococcoidia bacterium]|nr:MAG: 2-oxoacid:ferredoxin oxidoreductase subunit beta [Dehalococcoidia bacterium]UCG84357.1 MAG: 2-oxoacid:ferredoxin oxidoreductase subunit beta [Dehalococcoidia bacterium]